MVSEQSLEDIISGCKKGNRRAQEALYSNFYRVMMILCMRYTRNESDAVEVLNNGFLRVFKNISSFDPAKGSLYTWIRTILVNSCLDHIRQKQKWKMHESDEAVDMQIPAEVLEKMKAAELLALIRRLPPATQAVFNLYIMEGYSHREIAQLTGTSEGTSKWHLSEARKALQQMIKKQRVTHE